MKLSYNWLKEYIDIDLPSEELADTLTMLGMEVEEIIDLGQALDGFVTAEVIECVKHPDADKLSVCKVYDGEKEYGVVCGAPNVAKGQKVAFGKIGATVPAAGFKLEKRKLRGVVSEGMICAENELNLGSDTAGIWELPQDTNVGMHIADFAGVNDTVFDIFLTPNKADCNSHIGIARDLAAYLRLELKYPISYVREGEEDINEIARVTVVDKDNCPRYAGRVIKNVKVIESPKWLKQHLESVGLRPINAIADITNFVLMEYGQPLHAFDFDKISSREIIVKSAKDGAKFTTLDEKERKLDDNNLMIADREKNIAIAGVMGGLNSGITDETTNVFIESAFFNPTSIRKTSRKLALQTDASYRFERGVDFEALIPALDRAISLIQETCGGDIAKGLIDIYPDKIERDIVTLRTARARKVLGIDVSDNEIKDIMHRLNFTFIREKEGALQYAVPSYRVDVKSEIDLIEEVARIYNYDNIEPRYTSPIDFSGEKIIDILAINPLKSRIENYMVSNGFSEIVTQNMIDPASAEHYTDNPIRIANPLGEELSVMRPSVIPSMLKIVKNNMNKGNPDLLLFEIGKVFRRCHCDDPSFINGYTEVDKLIIVMTGNIYPKQWGVEQRKSDYYDIKGAVEDFLEYLKISDKVKYNKIKDVKPGFSSNAVGVFHKKQYIGILGEVDRNFLAKYDIKQDVMMAVISLNPIYSIANENIEYKPISSFPSSQRDLAFECDKSVELGNILSEIKNKGGKILKDAFLFDIYEGKGVAEGKKSAAFSLIFGADDRTLKENEIDKATKKIVDAVTKKFGVELRG